MAAAHVDASSPTRLAFVGFDEHQPCAHTAFCADSYVRAWLMCFCMSARATGRARIAAKKRMRLESDRKKGKVAVKEEKEAEAEEEDDGITAGLEDFFDVQLPKAESNTAPPMPTTLHACMCGITFPSLADAEQHIQLRHRPTNAQQQKLDPRAQLAYLLGAGLSPTDRMALFAVHEPWRG